MKQGSKLNFRNRAFAALGVTTAMIAFAAPAYAQDEDDAAGDGEIVVTAQFREQTLQETPLAITAITAETLEARSQTDIRDIAAQAPSVYLSFSRIGGGLVAYVRGIGQGDNSPHLEPGVGMYVDDVYLATMQGAMLNLIDIERIEVLRGPQGTLAGKNSIGGAIKMFSRKPTGDGSGYARATYGSFGRLEGRAAVDFTLADNLFVRANTTARVGGGYIDRIDYACENPNSGLPQTASDDDCKLGTMGGRSYVGARVALRWVPTDMIEVNLSGDYTSDFSDPYPSQMGIYNLTAFNNAANNPRTQYNGKKITPDFQTLGTNKSYATFCNLNGVAGPYCLDDTTRIDTWGIHGTIDVDLSDNLSVSSITAYRNFTSKGAADEDGSPFVFSNIDPGWMGDQFSQEVRLNASLLDEMVNVTLGGYYLESYVEGRGLIDIPTYFLTFLKGDEIRSHSKAGYAQVAIDPIDSLHIVGGARYTKEYKDYDFFRTSADGKFTPDPLLYNTNFTPYSFGHWDWRLNLSYDITDDIMAYAQYATGFKGGGLNGSPFFGDQVFPFFPETLKTIEGGVKSRFADGRVTLNVAGYWSDYTDIQLNAQTCPAPATPTPCAGIVNTGSAHVKGLEVETNIEPIDGLVIDGSLALLEFEYYKVSNSSLTLDQTPPNKPDFTWSAGVQYTAELGGAGTLTPRLDASYRSHIYAAVPNTPQNMLPARTIVNGRLTWENEEGDVSVALEVTNITNKKYLDALSTASFFGTIIGSPAAPRRWAVTVAKEF